MVELVGVAKGYRRTGRVLTGIDLTVAAGGPVVVVGVNGSGKSTLLRIAAGCSAPSTGRVSGRSTGVGYLPAPFPASSRLSVRSYLRHIAAIHGALPRRRGTKAPGEAVLEELGFTGALEGPVSQLSTGNVQKVGLAQALTGPVGLVVLDEPWTGLDTAAADALDRRLAETTASTAVLIADHGDRGRALPAVTVRRLAHGRLHPGSADPATGPVGPGREVMTVELRCPGEVPDAVAGLEAAVVGPASDDGTVRVVVPGARGDRLLAAALEAGCSVLSVTRGSRR